MIERSLEKMIRAKLKTGKAIILMGARQVGKTTLLKKLFEGDRDVLLEYHQRWTNVWYWRTTEQAEID